GEPRLQRHLADPVELALRDRGIVEGNDARDRDLEDASPAVAHALRNGEQLVVACERAGYRGAVETRVPERARGREAERAGLHRLRRETLHLGDVDGVG